MSVLARQASSPRRLVVFIVAALAASSAAARAQVPILDGHRFVPSMLAAWPFVDTEVSSTSETGITDFVIQPSFPPLVATLLPQQVDGRFLSATQTVAGSVAFGGIFSLTARLSASGLLPLDTPSSLVIGAHGAYGEGGGASLRLVGTEAFQLTLHAEFDALEVESIIPGQLTLPSSPRVSGHVFAVPASLAAALALSPRFGLQGSFTANFERYDVAQADDVTAVSGALAATVSLDPVPLTVLAGADVTHELGRDVFTPTAEAVFGADRTDWNIEAGLYITARSHLDIGLLFRGEVAGGDHNDLWHGLFRLGYYF